MDVVDVVGLPNGGDRKHGTDRGVPGAENRSGGRTEEGRQPLHRVFAREKALSWLLLVLQNILSVVLLLAASENTLRPEQFFAALWLSHRSAGSIAPISLPARRLR